MSTEPAEQKDRLAFFWRLPKPVVFSTAGAVGCFCGAFMGEPVALIADRPLPFLYTIVYVGGLGALLSLGLLLALIGAQNRYMMLPAFNRHQLLKAIPGGILAGFLSGALAQFVYAFVGSNDPSPVELFSFRFFWELMLRSVGWTVLGLMLGLGTTFFIPNMNRRHAIIAGACGGFVGCVGFFLIMAFFGATMGRLAGGALLGSCIGLAVVLVEVISRDVWAEIEAADGSVRRVNLGDTPIQIGQGAEYKKYDPNSSALQMHQSGFQIRKTQQGFLLESVACGTRTQETVPRAVKPGDEFNMTTDSLQMVRVRIRERQK
jgi:Ca-activated chloride channel family protein